MSDTVIASAVKIRSAVIWMALIVEFITVDAWTPLYAM
jgi:hypothetical protein